MVQELQNDIAALRKENTALKTKVEVTCKAKIKLPAKYRGSKEELTGFLVQMQVYLQYYSEQFT